MYNIMNCCKKKDNLLLYDTHENKTKNTMIFYYSIMVPVIVLIFIVIFILSHGSNSHDNNKNITLP